MKKYKLKNEEQFKTFVSEMNRKCTFGYKTGYTPKSYPCIACVSTSIETTPREGEFHHVDVAYICQEDFTTFFGKTTKMLKSDAKPHRWDGTVVEEK